MRALSIRQPWAWCIIHAGKDIENRNWRTPFRGRFLVHAAKGMTRAEYDDCLALVHAISETHPLPSGLTMPAPDELERGGIIGSVEITDCLDSSVSPWFFGPSGFVLRDPTPLLYRPLKGQLGWFEVAE